MNKKVHNKLNKLNKFNLLQTILNNKMKKLYKIHKIHKIIIKSTSHQHVNKAIHFLINKFINKPLN